MRKGTKAEFLSELFKFDTGNIIQMSDKLNQSELKTVYVIDAMAFIQRFRTLGSKTFLELALSYLHKMIELKPVGCDYVHFVGDRYDVADELSLKGDERLRRCQSKSSPAYIPVANLVIPDWNSFLKNPINKKNLLHYLSESWCQNCNLLPEGVSLILGGTFDEREKACIITRHHCDELHVLSCSTHEEADTRMIAHIYISSVMFDCKRVVVQCEDTDVVMLCMYHLCRLNIDELWVEKRNAFVPVHALVTTLSNYTNRSPLATTSTILACFVLSGCDTVSYPFRRGKRQAAKSALKMIGRFPNISSYGNESYNMVMTDAVLGEAREFFVDLYGRQEFTSLDVLRAHLWSSHEGDLRSLPPTEDAFRQHVLRALYQLALYKRAHLSEPLLPSPATFGRKVVNGHLVPIMMLSSPKPESIKALSCKCKRSKCLKACPCSKASVPCVVSCLCTGASGKCGRVKDKDTVDDFSSEDEL